MKTFRIKLNRSWKGVDGGFFLRIFRWYGMWRWSFKRPCGHWRFEIDIFSMERLESKHLIANNLEDTDDCGRFIPEEERRDIGIGMSFPWKGKQGRMAVRLKRDFGLKEFRKAWKLLADAEADPENPKFKVIWGNGRLSGNEMMIE